MFSQLIQNLDNTANLQRGENDHVEVEWSTYDVKELFTQYYFQLVRSKDLTKQREMYIKLLKLILSIENKFERVIFLHMVYKLVAQTRDIVDGKGEYSLSYMMIEVWSNLSSIIDNNMLTNNNCTALANNLFVHMVKFSDDKHPYGSWKDVKYYL